MSPIREDLRKAIALLLLLAVYVGAGRAGLALASVHPSASAVWAPSGIAFAALLILGYRAWPAIFAGALIVNLTTSGSIPASLMIAIGNTLEAVVGAYLINRFADGRHLFERVRHAARFVLLAGGVATALSATIGVGALLLTGLAPWAGVGHVWLTWWLGDATGILVVSPPLILWANSPRPGLSRQSAVEAVFLLAAFLLCSFAVFGVSSPLQHYPLPFLLLPLLMWCALRFGRRAVSSMIAALSVLTLWHTVNGYGPFAHYSTHEALLLLQVFMAVMSVASLILAIAVGERRRSELAVRDSEDRYRVVAETATDAIITIDAHSIIQFANHATEKIFGYRVADLVGRELTILMPESLHAEHKAGLARYLSSGQRHLSWTNVELPGRHRDGHDIPLEVSFGEFRQHGRHLFTGIIRDISERKRTLESQHWLATIAQSSSDAIIGKRLDGIVLSWNEAAERMYGYRAHEIIGQSIALIVPPDRPDEVAQILRRIRRGERVEHFETERVRKDGVRIAVSLTVSPIEDERGAIIGASAIARDITEYKRHEDRIRYLAQHDALTDLPNRVLLRDRLTQAIAQARRQRHGLAVLFLDLDGFKHINDSLGHLVGDRLLQVTAQRLRECLREGDSVARLGGDEFVVCLPNVRSGEDTTRIATKILDSLRKPYLIDRHELHITGSIGISLYPGDGEDVETLMRTADTAMYSAKQSGHDNYQFFTARLNETAQRRLLIANRLHQALKNNALALEFQPRVELERGRVLAAEALIRWQPADIEAVAAHEFVGVAEDTGLAVPIGEWVLRRACAQLRRWRQAGWRDLGIAVNLSPQQFRRPGFCAQLMQVLRENELPPIALELEITEGMLMANSADNVAILEELAHTGVRLAVDDFGTGYSNLAYLQRFPVRSLKIDRMFVQGIGRDPNDTAIVTAVIAMANSLHLKVVADGVENAGQAAFLKASGCFAAQGHFYSAPVAAEEFDALIDRFGAPSPTTQKTL